MNLRNAIQQLANTNEEVYSVMATVTSLDLNAGTCDVSPIDGSAEIFDVRLQAEPSKGLVIVPKVGTNVSITFLSKNDAFVSMASTVDSYIMETADDSLKKIMMDMLDMNKNMKVTTPVGPSGTPLPDVITTIESIKNRINNFFKK